MIKKILNEVALASVVVLYAILVLSLIIGGWTISSIIKGADRLKKIIMERTLS